METVMQIMIPEGNVAVAYRVEDKANLNSTVWVCSKCGEAFAKIRSTTMWERGFHYCSFRPGVCLECAKEDMWTHPWGVFTSAGEWAERMTTLAPAWLAYEIDRVLQEYENTRKQNEQYNPTTV